jgi:hypothetical protein
MMLEPRRFLALAAALFLGVTGYIAAHHFHPRHPSLIDVSDGQGHGPDHDSAEWRGAAERAVHRRAVIAAVVAGLLTFAVAIREIPPSGSD